MISPFLAFVCWYAKGEKQTGFYTVGTDFVSIVQYVLYIWIRIFQCMVCFGSDSLYYWIYCFEEGHIEEFCDNGSDQYSSCIPI